MTRISVLTISSIFGLLILIVAGCATNFEKSSKYFNAKGYEYHKKGQYDKAIVEYNKALDLSPQYVEAYGNRGNAYAAMGLHRDAIADYDRVIAINPNIGWAYMNKGVVYAKRGQYDQAISNISRGIDIDPKNGEMYFNRAHVYFYKHEYEKAWDDVSKAQNFGWQVHPEFLQELREASGKESFKKQVQRESEVEKKIVYAHYKIQFNELKNWEKLNPKLPNMILFGNPKNRSQIVIRAFSSGKTLNTDLEGRSNRWLTKLANFKGWEKIEIKADGNTVIDGEESYWQEYSSVSKGKKYNEKVYFVHGEHFFYVFRFYNSMHDEAFGNSVKEFDAWIKTIQFIR